ncbi:peptidoglycan recognition protein 1-like isoform X2 [Anticarsia gemmatalis]|uniref:peptidoglycan recognition protein 1-like isoform X2 n=1 Tax=Anticarsia gemmatalis TaxID=129554 RepID=UPI003F76CF1F
MWVEPRQELPMTMGRSSAGSDVVMIDPATNTQPAVTNLNVTKSSRVHIGPKFVSVTQNVDNTEVVKDLPFYRYVWEFAKNTSLAERLSCIIAILVLIICTLLIVYFTVLTKRTVPDDDVAPHEWYISREMWLNEIPFNTTERTTDFEPLNLVIIAHTVSAECHVFKNCATEMRNLHENHLAEHKYDLPYNFVIGNEGRVYEGRGWNVVGAHTLGYNRCSMGLAFIGDYREGSSGYSKVTDLQLQRASMLLAMGVRMGYLDSIFQVVGAKDLDPNTLSPGTNLYNRIRQWPNYAHDNVFRNRTCQQIYDYFKGNKTQAAEND